MAKAEIQSSSCRGTRRLHSFAPNSGGSNRRHVGYLGTLGRAGGSEAVSVALRVCQMILCSCVRQHPHRVEGDVVRRDHGYSAAIREAAGRGDWQWCAIKRRPILRTPFL
jgi:hypothetical protein